MKKALLVGVAVLSMLCASAAHTREWQGNMPKPVGKLPPYPPVVCVTPNWTPEPCESRQQSPENIFVILSRTLDDLDKPFKWLKWTETNWLGTALVFNKPQPWNGEWPKHTFVLEFEPGGIIGEHVKRWQGLAQSGADVEIRGPCFSACTLIVAYVPKQRLCFGDYASLNFHHAASTLSTTDAEAATYYMFSLYPREIREWINKQGGAEYLPMPFIGWWTLEAEELWEMGYRKCEPKPALPMVIRK